MKKNGKMKKSMIRLAAAGITAATLLGAFQAAAPANVYAAEAEALTSNRTRTVDENIYKSEANQIIQKAAATGTLVDEFDNTKIFKFGNKRVEYSVYDQEPLEIWGKGFDFNTRKEAEQFISDNMIENSNIKAETSYDYNVESSTRYAHTTYYVTGSIPLVNLVTVTEEVASVETIDLNCLVTCIKPGETTYIQATINDGAMYDDLTWEVWGPDGIAEIQSFGDYALVTGTGLGTVMVRVSAPSGAYAYVHISVLE